MMENFTSTSLTLNTTVGPSAITLSWNKFPASYFEVNCTGISEAPNNTGLIICSSSLHLKVDNSVTSIVVDKLVPGISYNCCVSAVEPTMFSNRVMDCEDVLMLRGGSAGLSTTIAGVIGGVVGAMVSLLIILAVVGIVVLCKTHRNKPHTNIQPPVTRTPSQRYTYAKDPSFLIESKGLPSTTTFTSTGTTHTYLTSPDNEDGGKLGHLYDSAVQASQHTAPCQSISAPRTEDAGELGMMDNISLEDTEQYEVMLAAAITPDYKNVHHGYISALPQVAQIYEQLP